MYNIYQIFSTLDHAPPGLPGSYSLQLKNSQSAFFTELILNNSWVFYL